MADLTFNVTLAKEKKAKGETDAKGRLQVRADGMSFTPSAGALAAPAAAAAKTKTLEIPAADISAIEWAHVSNGLQAKVLAKGTVWRFYGFTADAATTSNFFAAAKAMGKDVKKVETATKGQNWGQMNVKPGRLLSFESEDGKAVFDLPLAQVQQSVVQGKNEVSLEMHEEDDGMGVVLSEMRVYVPPNLDQQEGEPTAVEVFRNQIVDGADLGDGAVETICKFDELMFATPRGKYTIAIYPDFFKLQGKSFSYKIPYATISKLFLMSLPDKQHEHLVMSLSTAIRQGRTAYPFLIMTISQAQETENFKINLPEADFKGKYNGMLTPVMAKSKTADLVARVFKAIAEKKVLVPSSKFTAASGGRAVRCSLKANSGYLFFFEKSFFFVPKPAAYLPHSKVQSVEFRRLEEGGSNKSFDLVITMKGSDKDGHVFTSIDKSEHQMLFDFMRSHKLNIINQRSVEELLSSSADPTKRTKKNINYNEDDPYMSKINAERGDDKPAAGGGGGGDDDDDDEDDDFVAEASSDSGDDGVGSGSGSDSDSGSGSGSDSDDDKKKTKTKGKRKRDSDSDDDGGKKKSAPKKKADAKPKEKKEKKGAARSKSSYLFFADEERARIKADPAHKDKTFGEVGKLLGDRWAALSKEAKAPYEAKANQDKERVKAANAANGGADAKAKASKPRAGKKADANAPPSRAKSAYQFFAADERARLKKAGDKSDAKELTKKITATWKELPAKDKEKYENLHLEDDDRYHREKKEWDAAHPELAKEMAESKKKKKKKGAADDDDGDDDADKPKPKPVTATIKKPAAAAAAAPKPAAPKPAAAAAAKPAAKPAAAAAAKPAAKADKPTPMET